MYEIQESPRERQRFVRLQTVANILQRILFYRSSVKTYASFSENPLFKSRHGNRPIFTEVVVFLVSPGKCLVDVQIG